MKHPVAPLVTLALLCCALLSCALLSCADQPDASPPTPEAALSKATPPPSRVILQGLMAFVKTQDGNHPTLDALLVKTGARPRILSEEQAQPLHLPTHEPFVAVENGEISGESCFIDTSQVVPLHLSWETGNAPGGGLLLSSHPLCSGPHCGVIHLEVGTTHFQNPFDLEDLVDKSDFENFQEGFLRLDPIQDTDLVARIKVTKGKDIRAEIVENTPYNTKDIERIGALEVAACPKGAGKPFAEQVSVTGQGPVHLSSTSGSCVISPRDSEKEMRVWFFHAFRNGYRFPEAGLELPLPHHEAFYWFYDLASTPRNQAAPLKGEGEIYSRPCVFGGNLGDPKCPQPLLDPPP